MPGPAGSGRRRSQLARAWGLEVFATASPAKQAALAALGVDADHIASTRDLGFRDRFLAATGGEGVDMVLNALAGEFTDASLDLLPRGGRFVEMGKTDIRDAAAGRPVVARGGVPGVRPDGRGPGPDRGDAGRAAGPCSPPGRCSRPR